MNYDMLRHTEIFHAIVTKEKGVIPLEYNIVTIRVLIIR